jgi:hypothetical protein
MTGEFDKINCKGLKKYMSEFHRKTKINDLKIDELIEVFPDAAESLSLDSLMVTRLLLSEEFKNIKHTRLIKFYSENCK